MNIILFWVGILPIFFITTFLQFCISEKIAKSNSIHQDANVGATISIVNDTLQIPNMIVERN